MNPPAKKGGRWINPVIVASVLKKKIDWNDAALAGLIESLSRKNPCFASNGYFSKQIGFSIRQIQRMLVNLEQAKLIVITTDEVGRRTIKLKEKK